MPLLAPRYKGLRIAQFVETNNTKPHADVYNNYVQPQHTTVVVHCALYIIKLV